MIELGNYGDAVYLSAHCPAGPEVLRGFRQHLDTLLASASVKIDESSVPEDMHMAKWWTGRRPLGNAATAAV